MQARANEPLLQGFRRYMLTQLNAPRCQPSIQLDSGPEWAAIAAEDLKPPKLKESFKVEPYFDSADSKRLGESLTSLRTTDPEQWPGRFNNFLRDYAAWQPEGSGIDAFHQRATVLRALLEITTRRGDRDQVLALCVSLLQTTNAEAPAEWLWEARAIIDAARADAPKLLAAPSLKFYSELGYFGDSSGTSK
jgi:hypothetical protein